MIEVGEKERKPIQLCTLMEGFGFERDLYPYPITTQTQSLLSNVGIVMFYEEVIPQRDT